jgi:hypothetical protein
MIHYYRHNEINKDAWDNCIENSHNGLVYGCSWYLDIACPGWEALIDDDYETIMPLPVKNKFGLSYLIRPYFTQQLGIFSIKSVTENLVSEFINSIPTHFKYCNFYLNSECNISAPNIYENGITYVLPLHQSYKSIYNEFSTNNKRNLKKAQDLELKVSNLENSELFCTFYNNHGKFNLGKRFISLLKTLVGEIRQRNMGEIKVVYNRNNEILSAVLWLKHKKWIIYLISCSSNEGKEQRSNFLLVDTFLKENSENNLMVDFEGSSIPGLARFYEGFGARPLKFPLLKYNQLPFPFNLFKR